LDCRLSLHSHSARWFGSRLGIAVPTTDLTDAEACQAAPTLPAKTDIMGMLAADDDYSALALGFHALMEE
jgi:hypothetical protein